MGVGINEASKLGGAIAAVGVAGRMIDQEKNEALAGGTQAAKALADVGEGLDADFEEKNKLDATLQNQKKEAETLKSMLDPSMSKGDAQAWTELKEGLDKDMEKANIALTTLRGKIAAKKAVQVRAKRQLDKANL